MPGHMRRLQLNKHICTGHTVAVTVLLALPWVSPTAFSASAETRRYCEEMYSPEYYTPEERSAYVNDCVASYAGVFDNDSVSEPEYVAPDPEQEIRTSEWQEPDEPVTDQ